MFSIAPANEPVELKKGIGLARAQNDENHELWENFDGALIVRNVSAPQIYVFEPPRDVVNRRQAVLVVPGGGMMMLALKHEGIDVAEHLSREGYTAFVLKYRVHPTPADPNAFMKLSEDFVAENLTSGFGNFQSRIKTENGVADAISAIKHIKENSRDFELDPDKVHFLGFSAGAVIGQDLISVASEQSQPSTLACIYGDMREVTLNEKKPPPLFLALSNDDPFFPDKVLE